MNSIIEAQITLQEERAKEIERCKDPLYFYKNYMLINGKKPTPRDIEKKRLNQILDSNPFVSMSYRGVNLLRPISHSVEDIDRK